MSNVVAFRLQPRARPLLPRRGWTGHILLFTGVRYVHDEVEPTTPTAVTAPDVTVDATATERLKA